jgi:hypothetical protein
VHDKATRRRKEALTIHIRIPRRHHRREPRYVSAATEGITLALTGPTNLDQTLGVTPSNNPDCSGHAGGPYACNVTVQLLPGAYTASISTYDAVSCSGSACTIPGSAHVLSTAQNVPFTTKAGTANDLGFTLDGVVAALSVSGLPSATAGTAFGAPKDFTVVAKDADAYTIVGTYQSPIAIGDGDGSGATKLATSGSDDPPAGVLLSSSDAATLTYTGLAILPVTILAITATASGAVSGSGTFAPALQPIVVTTSDTLNPNFIGVDLYATSGTGSSGSLTISEVGWTNSPYNKSLVATPGSGCTTIGNVNLSGTAFAVNVANAPSPGSCAVAITDQVGQSQPVTLAYTSFSYTGAVQTVTLPSGVTAMTTLALGAAGMEGGFELTGPGASLIATLGVSAGETLFVYVGGGGGNVMNPGFNGGASGGGGASDVRTSNTAALTGNSSTDPRIVVAGGGGAAGDVNGGNGGAVGGNGGSGGDLDGGIGGGGGTQIAGGAGGSTPCTLGFGMGAPGLAGVGGFSASGGGGGGWFGGGGGGLNGNCDDGGAGGGGSSFVESSATFITSTAGSNPNNNGQVTIVW